MDPETKETVPTDYAPTMSQQLTSDQPVAGGGQSPSAAGALLLPSVDLGPEIMAVDANDA
jgi:hypothetical protein